MRALRTRPTNLHDRLRTSVLLPTSVSTVRLVARAFDAHASARRRNAFQSITKYVYSTKTRNMSNSRACVPVLHDVAARLVAHIQLLVRHSKAAACCTQDFLGLNKCCRSAALQQLSYQRSKQHRAGTCARLPTQSTASWQAPWRCLDAPKPTDPYGCEMYCELALCALCIVKWCTAACAVRTRMCCTDDSCGVLSVLPLCTTSMAITKVCESFSDASGGSCTSYVPASSTTNPAVPTRG